LFQHHQELADAGFAGAVAAKQHRDGGQPQFAGVSPALEILDS
jgi:hypothetical protein